MTNYECTKMCSHVTDIILHLIYKVLMTGISKHLADIRTQGAFSILLVKSDQALRSQFSLLE